MDKKDISNACGDILNDVVDAINRNDYSELNYKINNTVNDIARQIKAEVGQSFGQYTKPYEQQQPRPDYQSGANPYKQRDNVRMNGQMTGQERQQRQVPMSYNRQNVITTKPAGRISGMIQLISGIVCTSTFGIAALVMLVLFVLLPESVFAVIGGICLIGVIAGISNISGGNKKLDLVKRFRRYVSLIGHRDYIEVKELATATGMPKYKIIRDLEQMIQKNMFMQGCLDTKKTTLMLTQDIYQQYVETEQWRKEHGDAPMPPKAKEKPKPIPEENFSAYDAEVQKILNDGQKYIETVRRCNDDIPNEQVSDKLYRLENIMGRIFEQVKKNPESAEDLHQLMDYYLPTTIKLLDAYIDLDKQNISGDNINTTKREIEEVLDTINQAFEKLLDSMFEDTAWDISSDISVMKTMMKQEGLTENNDFKNI